ncbi:methionine ABC transporter ATP-binding protein [Salisediminibacterium halotolerans]|uniref:D-methionine transport system ATP-binding protein n=1 Tax=Salisediminibacterium halotolerans TaxID=517425 RepID=A0A1H9VNF5_9BACI|nr:methionine ABC transporter ATP-binding protein [Salisediminibacterium haloalkalitolerans]SES23079.1 D-methionine transport system ATP-binding protein [Salisediminibacterium haloalkalitolerans]
MISLTKLTKIFPSAQEPITAVDDINLTIPAGEIFGVIGYSGAGKSTLIRLLNQLEEPTSGEVSVDGKTISKLSKQELRFARQEIGMIFQHFNLLWSRTVAENIAFPLEIKGEDKEKKEQRINELIDLVGLTGRGDAYPSQLSGGQKQRVGIARALANNPKVLLCDEATSALDPKTTDSILDLLTDINQKLGLTIVLITHEMHVIRKICHSVAVMEEGRFVEQGDVLNVFKHPKEAMTKEFVKQVTEPDDTEEALQHLFDGAHQGHLCRLTFTGNDAKRTLINDVIRSYDVTVNILQGKLSQTRHGTYGTLFIQMQGEPPAIEEVLAYIRGHEVDVEVISHD